MAGVEVRIEAPDLGQASARLRQLLSRLGDLTPVMDEIGAHLSLTTSERFETGTGPDGKAWKPSIRAQLQGGLTLVDSGRLRDSVTWRPGRDRVEIGSNLVYAAIHQLGGEAGRGHAVTLPARPYLGISRDDEAAIGEILDDYLSGAVQ